MNKQEKKRKNWHEFYIFFIKNIRFKTKIITFWSNKKKGITKYQLLIWKDNDSLCFKFGKNYGFGSCWETILPKPKNNLINKKNPKLTFL